MGRFGPPPNAIPLPKRGPSGHPRAKAAAAAAPVASSKKGQHKVVSANPPKAAVARRANNASAAAAEGDIETASTSIPRSLREKRSKMDAARAVGYRESLLSKLNAVVLHWPTAQGSTGKQSKRMAEAVRLLANLSKDLREAGLMSVEKIVAWVLSVSDSKTGPQPFLWNGSDYLLKMFTDLDFVCDALGGRAWVVGCFAKGNPLLLSEEEMAGRGPHGRAHANRVRAASMVLLDVLRRNGALQATLEGSPPPAKPQQQKLKVDVGGGGEETEDKKRPSTGNSSSRMNTNKKEVAGSRRDGSVGEKVPNAKPDTESGRPTGIQTPSTPLPSQPPLLALEKTKSLAALTHKKSSAPQLMPAAAATESHRQHEEGQDPAPPVLLAKTIRVCTPELASPSATTEVEDSAAVKLQARARGKQAKTKVAQIKREKESESAKQYVAAAAAAGVEAEVRRRAAIRLQGLGRQRAAKIAVERKRATRREGERQKKQREEEQEEKQRQQKQKQQKDYEEDHRQQAQQNEEDEEKQRQQKQQKDDDDDDDDDDEEDDYGDDDYDDEVSEDNDEADKKETENDEEGVELIEDEDSPPAHATAASPPSSSSSSPSSINDWVTERQLGEGNYGDVFLVRHKRSKVQGAMKRFKGSEEGDDEDEDDEETAAYVLKTQERELALAFKLSHPSIVTLLASSFQAPAVGKPPPPPSEPFLVFELMPMNLLQALERQQTLRPKSLLPTPTIRSLLKQLCEALAHCHALGIVHRDLKPENILVRDLEPGARPVLKLCDFGAARELSQSSSPPSARPLTQGARSKNQFEDATSNNADDGDDLTNYVGSRWYRAPESLANRTEYGVEVDVWGFGCIAAELGSGGLNLFGGDDEEEVLASMASLLGPPPPAEHAAFESHGVTPPLGASKRRSLESPVDHRLGLGEAGCALVGAVLRWEASSRPTAERCLAHNYFTCEEDALASQSPPPLPGSPAAAAVEEEEEEVEAVVEEEEEEEEELEVEEEAVVEEKDGEEEEEYVDDKYSVEDEDAAGVQSASPAPLAANEQKVAEPPRDVEAFASWAHLESQWDSGAVAALKRAVDVSAGADEREGAGSTDDRLSALTEVLGRRDAEYALSAWVAGTSTQPSPPLAVLVSLAAVLHRCMNALVLEDVDWCSSWISQQRSKHTSIASVAKAFDESDPRAAAKTPRLLARAETSLKTAASVLQRISEVEGEGVGAEKLESPAVASLLSSLTPLLLDPRESAASKRRGLSLLDDAIFLFGAGSKDERMLLLAWNGKFPALIPPQMKTTLLHARLSNQDDDDGGGGGDRLVVVTERTHALETTFNLLDKTGLLDDDDGGGGGGGASRRPRVGKACVKLLSPYYCSGYGEKVVEGRRVEEGEGLGPRKELFSLLSSQLQEKWGDVAGVVAAVSGQFQAGSATLVLEELVRSGGGGERVSAQSLLGCRLVHTSGGVGEKAQEGVIVIAVDSKDEATTLLRLDRAFFKADGPAASSRVELRVQRKAEPVLVYVQGSEVVWVNPLLPRAPRHEKRVRAFGLLLGLTVANMCHMDLAIAPLLLRLLLRAQPHTSWQPSLPDLIELDPSYVSTVDGITHMRGADFEAMLSAEYETADAVPLRMRKQAGAGMQGRKQAYVEEAVVRAHFAALSEWQLEALGKGFHTALPPPVLTEMGLTARDLSVALCGVREASGVAADFDIRDVFRVAEDAELVAPENKPLRDAFWGTVDNLAPAEKRQLLLFITGVARLPPRGSEQLTIEMPFFPMGLEEHRKNLQLIPTSHTCDNILELPNYWKSLLKAKGGKVDEQTLLCELRSILGQKITIACDNAAGYALDGPSGGGGDDRDSDEGVHEALSGDNDRLTPVDADGRGGAEDEEASIPGMSSGHISIPDIPDADSARSSLGSATPRGASSNGQRTPREVELPLKTDVQHRTEQKESGDSDGGYEDEDYEEEFEFEEESGEM